MAFLEFRGVKIEGISACVPSDIIENNEAGLSVFTKEELDKTIASIGVSRRRVADSSVTTSDLCFGAATALIEELQVEKEDIGALIFLSQTPDYRLPATSCILQDRLGLGKGTMALDINLGCSGYVYGLSVAFNLLAQPSIKKVLLLVGDTATKCVSPLDKSSVLLFGDAGTATILGKDAGSGPFYCSLNSDGAGAKSLIIKGGAYRTPSSEKTLEMMSFPDNNSRTLENIFMDGAEIFNFTLREIPKDVNRLLEHAGITNSDVGYFFFHQANKFMIDFLAKKIKIPQEKYPLSLGEFGNTSSASIPLTIVQSRGNFDAGPVKAVLTGFGVGLSWGTMLLDFNNCRILPVKEI